MKDLSGLKFGRMTVIRFNKLRYSRYLWDCRCDCGTEKTVGAEDLKAGKVKSCGCLKSETTASRNTTHGMIGHPLYSTWAGMLQRCRDTNRRDSQYYSLKGVKVCERWASFENFVSDMAPSYSEGLTLHRKISSKGYEPGNVVWADWETQNTESANVRIIVIDGESNSVARWCRKMGIKKHTFYNRVQRGWAEKQAILTPSSVRNL